MGTHILLNHISYWLSEMKKFGSFYTNSHFEELAVTLTAEVCPQGLIVILLGLGLVQAVKSRKKHIKISFHKKSLS